MAAIRRNASCVVCVLDPSARPTSARRANPCGSRTRVRSATSPAGVAGVSNQLRLGRSTSAQTSIDMARAMFSPMCSESPARSGIPDRCSCIGSRRQAWLPCASAALASHRSCQVSPGWRSNQSRTRIRPRRRFREPGRTGQERVGHQPGHQLCSRGPGRRPVSGERTGWESAQQRDRRRRPGRGPPGRSGPLIQTATHDSGRLAADLIGGAHAGPCPNSTSRDCCR